MGDVKVEGGGGQIIGEVSVESMVLLHREMVKDICSHIIKYFPENFVNGRRNCISREFMQVFHDPYQKGPSSIGSFQIEEPSKSDLLGYRKWEEGKTYFNSHPIGS